MVIALAMHHSLLLLRATQGAQPTWLHDHETCECVDDVDGPPLHGRRSRYCGGRGGRGSKYGVEAVIVVVVVAFGLD